MRVRSIQGCFEILAQCFCSQIAAQARCFSGGAAQEVQPIRGTSVVQLHVRAGHLVLREVKVARSVLVIDANQLLQLGNVDPETGEILQEAQAKPTLGGLGTKI